MPSPLRALAVVGLSVSSTTIDWWLLLLLLSRPSLLKGRPSLASRLPEGDAKDADDDDDENDELEENCST